MESKKINQLATSVSPQTSDLTIIGDPITGVSKKITLLQIANLFATTGTVSSVAVTETGDALTITGSPITSTGTINIGFAGDATQYVRGDGALADFPTSTGGGSSVSYYLNSSVSQGTIGGVAYRELSKDPISGAGTDITISANGYVASYITDANDPALLEVPGGNFNCEFYFSVNSDAHNPYVYAELYKYDGTTFTLLGSSQSVPEYLSNGTTLSPYYFAIPVAASALTITDRLAIRIYANVDTREVTLHTENNHLCQVVTTFSKGLTSLNNLTRQVQFLATGTSGTDFAISSSTATHTFNLPVASATNTGKLSSTDWSTFNAKQPAGNYVTLDTNQTITGDKIFSGNNVYNGVNTYDAFQTRFTAGIAINQTLSGGAVSSHTVIGANVNGLNVNFPAGGYNSLNFASTSVGNTYTFPNATGTIALTSQLTSGTVTSVGLSSATSGVTIGSSPITTSGTITLAIATASGSQNGLLSSTDWTTFNGKQDALNGTGFVKISGTTISYDNSTYLTTSAAASTYLPLSGGTLTGALNGTSAVFSGSVTATTFEATDVESGVSANYYSPYSGGSSSILSFLYGSSGSVTWNNGGVKMTLTSAGALQVTSSLSATSATLNGSVTINSTAAALSPLQVVATGTIVRLGEQSGTTGKQFLIGIDGTSGRTELQSVWQGTSFTSLALQPSGGNVLIGTTTDNGAKLQVSGTATFSSNIGIGTSSPIAPLSIPANTTNSQITTGSIEIQSYALNNSWIGDNVYFNGSAFKARNTGYVSQIYFNTNGNIEFYTYNGTISAGSSVGLSQRMGITKEGNVLIGKTTTNIDAADGVRFDENGSIFASIVTGEATYYVRDITNSVYRFYVTAAGTINATNTTISAISDVRLKENISDLEIGLDAIMALRPRKFDWKKGSGNDGKNIRGFIAQEFEEIFPDLIDESINPAPEGEEPYKQIRQDLIPILVKAMQQQQAQIEELKELIKNK